MEEIKEYNEILEELYVQHNVEELLNFNETNIQEKLAINSAKLYHYTELYQKSLYEHTKICDLRDKIIGEKYNHYKTNADALLRQGEIEKYYLPTDKEVIKINTILRNQKAYVDFYENLKKALEKQSWNMQTFLKSMTYGV